MTVTSVHGEKTNQTYYLRRRHRGGHRIEDAGTRICNTADHSRITSCITLSAHLEEALGGDAAVSVIISVGALPPLLSVFPAERRPVTELLHGAREQLVDGERSCRRRPRLGHPQLHLAVPLARPQGRTRGGRDGSCGSEVRDSDAAYG